MTTRRKKTARREKTARGKKKPPPLSGVRVLVGRARSQAPALSAALRREGARVLEVPFIEIRPPRSFRPLDGALRRIAEYDWLILTSVNGVDALWERMQKRKMTKAKLAHLRIAAIGPATRAALVKRGLRVSVMPREYVAEAVVDALQKKVKGKRVLLVRARVARDVIPRRLRRAGARVEVVEAYQTVLPAASRTRLRALFADPRRRPQAVTFTSSSTARNFRRLLGARAAALQGVRFASIGPVTSATLRALGLPVDVEAGEYTMSGLVRALAAAFGPAHS